MKQKLLRLTTADISLDVLLKGQLKFLNDYYEVVGVAADTGLLENVEQREGIRTVAVPMHREISLWADLKCLWNLFWLFRRERPYILHANTPKGSLLAMLAGWLARVPHRIYLVTGLRYQGATGAFRWILMTMERLSCLCATKVIPEGKGVKKALLMDGITRKPLRVVHYGNINGIDTAYYSQEALSKDRIALRQELHFSDSDFVFVFIGRIVRDKGMNELADAMKALVKEYPACKLILVGSFEPEDPLEDDRESFFKTSEHVCFVGWQNDVRPYLAAADALVFPSYREGFPNVVLQAGSMGLPSIVTDINGCNEIVFDGYNGYIIPPHSEKALEQMMRKFLTTPKEVARMAANARSSIVERYEQRDVWNALLEVYQTIDDKK